MLISAAKRSSTHQISSALPFRLVSFKMCMAYNRRITIRVNHFSFSVLVITLWLNSSFGNILLHLSLHGGLLSYCQKMSNLINRAVLFRLFSVHEDLLGFRQVLALIKNTSFLTDCKNCVIQQSEKPFSDNICQRLLATTFTHICMHLFPKQKVV